MKLAELQISTLEAVLAARHKASKLVLSLGASGVEATRFAAGLSQICRQALRASPSVAVGFAFDFDVPERGLSVRFDAPGLARDGLPEGLFDVMEFADGGVRVEPRISGGVTQPPPEWLGQAREMLEEKSRVELMAELKEQNTRLEKHRDELEATVADRTRDLRAATAVAQRASAAKTDFLSHMSHELRTPLNGVLGYTQVLLRDRTTTPGQKKSLAAIESCGRHLLALINDVLDLAKIEAGRLELDDKAIDLHAVLDGACHITEPRASGKGIRVVQERAPDVPRFIMGDDTKLKQVVVNLMGNSAKFTEAGSVTLRATLAGGARVRIEVEDTGIGMTKEELLGVFEPFKQAEGGKVSGGTGLGLAISRRMVEAMGGSIEVASEKGRGTTFWFELPVRPAEAGEVELVRSAGWSAAGAKLVLPGNRVPRALVVDDNQVNRDVAESILLDAGFEVSTANDGQGALDAMRAQHYDAVLMDIRMPGMGGDEAIRLIRADQALRSVKVIAMTASMETGLVEHLVSLGFDAALSKPFEVSTLLSLLARELGASEPAREAAVENAPTPSDSVPTPPVDPAAAGELAREIDEALALGDLEGLVEIGDSLGKAGGPLAAYGRRLSELGGSFDFDGLGRLAKELRKGQATS